MSDEEKMEFITRMVAMWQARRIPAHRALAVIKDTVKNLKPKNQNYATRHKTRKDSGTTIKGPRATH